MKTKPKQLNTFRRVISEYWLAVKRNASIPIDWKEQILEMGAEGSGYGLRMKIKATEEVLEKIRSKFGQFLHIEPVIKHNI